ncbi:LysM domain-containing protein [Streptomyces griseoaurantiacus]|uniref:LysM peptidoglycan-binding domain-containing protein n=1 Tax=Streptomyces griseoaurantiacus TaxID=68213 RepID=UPI0030E50E13
MATPAQPPGKGPAAPGKAGDKLAGKVGGRRNLMFAAAGAVALVAFLMARTSGGGGGGGSDQVMMGYDSTPYDQYNDIQGQLEDLQRQMDEGRVTPGLPKPPDETPASPKPKPTDPKPKPPTKPIESNHPPAKKYVTIKKGDTLSSIAKKAGISMATLKKLNPVFWTNKKYKNGNLIWAGGKVRTK